VRHFDVLGIGVAARDVVRLGLAGALDGLALPDDVRFLLAPGLEAGKLCW
jgi:hypothetical protein